MTESGVKQLRTKFLKAMGGEGNPDSEFLSDIVNRGTPIGFELKQIPAKEGLLRGVLLFGEDEDGKSITYLRQLEGPGKTEFRDLFTQAIREAAKNQGYDCDFGIGPEKTEHVPKGYIMMVSDSRGYAKFADFIRTVENFTEAAIALGGIKDLALDTSSALSQP